MIAYADNKNAEYLRTKSKSYFEKKLNRKIIKFKKYYHPEGTHYFSQKPSFAKLVNPLPHVYVIGEAVSKHQGWVEGALSTAVRFCKGFNKC
jgi:monoamine oxidase